MMLSRRNANAAVSTADAWGAHWRQNREPRAILGHLVWATLPIWSVWDRTRIADWAGHYYVAKARKPPNAAR
jgi:hypothetical protein